MESNNIIVESSDNSSGADSIVPETSENGQNYYVRLKIASYQTDPEGLLSGPIQRQSSITVKDLVSTNIQVSTDIRYFEMPADANIDMSRAMLLNGFDHTSVDAYEDIDPYKNVSIIKLPKLANYRVEITRPSDSTGDIKWCMIPDGWQQTDQRAKSWVESEVKSYNNWKTQDSYISDFYTRYIVVVGDNDRGNNPGGEVSMTITATSNSDPNTNKKTFDFYSRYTIALDAWFDITEKMPDKDTGHHPNRTDRERNANTLNQSFLWLHVPVGFRINILDAGGKEINYFKNTSYLQPLELRDDILEKAQIRCVAKRQSGSSTTTAQFAGCLWNYMLRMTTLNNYSYYCFHYIRGEHYNETITSFLNCNLGIMYTNWGDVPYYKRAFPDSFNECCFNDGSRTTNVANTYLVEDNFTSFNEEVNFAQNRTAQWFFFWADWMYFVYWTDWTCRGELYSAWNKFYLDVVPHPHEDKCHVKYILYRNYLDDSSNKRPWWNFDAEDNSHELPKRKNSGSEAWYEEWQ